MTKLSIVIVNWNVRDLLRQCLLSLRKAAKTIDTEIYVVDNASTDNSVEMLQKEFPEIILIANQENKWFPHANNQALRNVKGEYTLLLNPDTVVKEDTLVKLTGFLDNHPEVGMVGPKILNPDGRIQYECARELPTLSGFFFSIFTLTRLFPHHKIFAKELLGGWDHKNNRFVAAISGACMLIRTDLLKKTVDSSIRSPEPITGLRNSELLSTIPTPSGGSGQEPLRGVGACNSPDKTSGSNSQPIGFLDETFPMYFEDIDLCQRVNQSGAKIYYLSDAEITHYSGQSTKKHINYYTVETIQLKAAKYFFTKYQPSLKLFMFNLILITGSSLRIILIFFIWSFLSLIGRKSDDFSLGTLKKYLIALTIGLT